MAKPLIGFMLLSLMALPHPVQGEDIRRAAVRTSIERGLEIVQKAARNYPKHRNCFSCHHQTLPMLAMHDARSAGIEIDEVLMRGQVEFIREAFEDRLDSVAEGKSVGGRSLTAGYALWALELAGQGEDEFSDALVSYLLKNQKEDGRWDVQTNRPPSEESKIHTTMLAVRTMKTFVRGEKTSAKVKAATEKARSWLATSEPDSQEDINATYQFALTMGGDVDTIAAARQAILDAQHDDGGWSQLPDMESDAYATGQTLHFLSAGIGPTKQDGEVKAAIARAVAYLLRTQHDDGSWFVKTRSKPIQKLFENGDPHGKNQFISIAATGWAVAALSAAIPPPEE